MKLILEWSRPILLRDATQENLIYKVELEKIPVSSGVYILGRRWGKQFEALYVGKANNIRRRVKGQLNNLRLMQHLKNARGGKRIVLAGRLMPRPGQQRDRCLPVVERALIRYFLAEGHDLVNKQGTRLSRHEVTSNGRHPKRFFPSVMYVEKRRGG